MEREATVERTLNECEGAKVGGLIDCRNAGILTKLACPSHRWEVNGQGGRVRAARVKSALLCIDQMQ